VVTFSQKNFSAAAVICGLSFFFCAQANAALTDDVRRVRIVRKMIASMRTWDARKDWERLYAYKDGYRSWAEHSLALVDPSSSWYPEVLFRRWQLSVLFSSPDKALFSACVRAVEVPAGMSERMRLARSIAEELSMWGRPEERTAILRVYADAAATSSDLDFLRAEAEGLFVAGDVGAAAVVTARRVAVRGNDFTLDEMIEVLNMFANTGMNATPLRDFSRALFDHAADLASCKDAVEIEYLRAVDAEHRDEYREAHDRYAALLSRADAALFSDELRVRISYLDRYHLGSPGTADAIFSAVKDPALLSRGTGKGTAYADAVVTAVLGGSEVLLGNRLRIKPHATCVAEGELLRIDGVSGDSDTGSLIMSGMFLWGGDAGQDLITVNLPTIDVRYAGPGFKVVTLVHEMPGGISGYDAALVSVYRPAITLTKTHFLVSEPVTMQVTLTPYVPERFVSVRWEIKEHPNLSLQGAKVEADVGVPGKYTFCAHVSIFGKQCALLEQPISVE